VFAQNRLKTKHKSGKKNMWLTENYYPRINKQW